MDQTDHASQGLKGLDPESRQMVLDTVESVRERLLDKETVLDLDEREVFPEDILRTLLGPEVGIQLLFIPEQFDGMGGGAADSCAVTRAMSRICLGVSTAFFALQLGADPILVAGTPEQKKKWLGKIADGSSLVAYAATEAEAGSNLASIQTRAEPVTNADGNITGYIINGAKQFISTGGFADFVTVLAKTDQGPTFFIVEKGTPGFSPGKPEKKHGIRASNTSPLTFSDVLVPIENLVGDQPGKGLSQANQVFGETRLMVAAMALGAAEQALDIVVPYAKQRIQFKSPLSEKQGYTHKLVVPHAVRMMGAEAYIQAVAKRLDSGETGLDVEGSIAKYFTTECADQACNDAMQALGGYGYIAEYEVEKIKRDVKITCIYEGTSEIQQNIISTFRWKKTFKTKGAFYTEMADTLDSIEKNHPETGAKNLALTARIVKDTFMLAHKERLTRQQCIMFALADMATWVEIGHELCLCAAELVKSQSPDAEKTVLASRIFSVEVAQKVLQGALLAAQGTGELTDAVSEAFLEGLPTETLLKAGHGVVRDMDSMAALLFEG